ncbi:uncharacterized protein LOC133533215 [Cydia pomonella]|uniref:uncharacterized protein LOC133533215 n=1 Tax=Cydia pomonella TaxID=82600 RepID=UPI002ADDF170|nr:uncharacterized protein LOC133533215 [Cydia pomonella]
MKRTRGRNLVSMVLNETRDRDSSESPLPPGAETLRDEIEFLDKIDLDSIESEPFSETVLFSNTSLQQSCGSPNSVEHQIISVVADVHDVNSNKLNTRQVLKTTRKTCQQKGNSQEFEDWDESSILPIDYTNSPISDLNMTQESIQCLTPMPLNLRDFSPTGSDTCLDFGNDNSPFPSDYTGSPLSTPGNRKRKSQKKKDLGNLRETYQDMWIDEKRKYNVNRGLKYTSRNGKIKLEKQIKPPCPPTCKKKCTVHLTQSEREKIFNMFWKIGNHTRQWDFIAKYAKREKVNRTTKSDSMRTCTVKYFFSKKERRYW